MLSLRLPFFRYFHRYCSSLALFCFTVWLLPGHLALAQATPELPRLEYYVARDLYDAGNISEATDGFRVAMNRGQQLKGQRWIDSVPPLVMLGDCYYQQGAIAQALEQYDAALMVVLAFPNWADSLRSAEAQPEAASEVKGINWTKITRRTQLVRVPNVMQLTLDAASARVNQGGGPGTILRVDVGEVLRCLAVALHRRTQLLGPLARHSPLSAPLAELFSKPPQNPTPWVPTAWRALSGLAMQAVGDDTQAKTLLTAGASIDNKLDYFLTPACLLSLAGMDIQQGNDAAALNRLGDASIRAAQLEQADTLAECLLTIGQVACADRRADLLPMLQAAVTWCQNYSILPYMAGSASVSELAVVANNLPVHEAVTKQMLNLLRGQDRSKDVVLPRVQAQLGYAMARGAALQSRLGLAEQQLETSTSLLRGSPSTGASTPRVFQTQLTLELLTRGNLSPADGEQVLDFLLGEPGDEFWRRYPLECLVSISTTHLPAYEKWLELAERRGDVEQVMARMDHTQRERFYELLPLGGRLLAARQTLHAAKQDWSPEVVAKMEPLFKAFPAAMTLPPTVREIMDGLSTEPIATEDRQISAESKKRFSEIAKLAEAEENAVMSLALQRAGIPRHWPAPVELPDIHQLLEERDVVISFVHTPTTIYGAAVTRSGKYIWSVAESPSVDSKIALLLTQIGLAGAPNLDVATPNLPWRVSASELAKTLLPMEARQMIDTARRVIIVPSGNLWYLPFDLLPISDSDLRTPLLARHSICYVPTLAHLRLINSPAPSVRNTVGLFSTFFAADRVVNQTLAGQIGQGLPQVAKLDVQQKSSLSSPSWLRLRSDQIWVAAELPMVKTPWELRVLPLEPSKENALANWTQSPLKSPSRIFLPGLQSHAQRVEMSGGNELFLPACTFLAAGVRSAWVSRWKVGGRSSHTALSRVIDELEFESPSAAWQRAAIALWAEKLPTSEEPLLPAAKALPVTIDGSHPLLWSGYMMIGDHRPPQ